MDAWTIAVGILIAAVILWAVPFVVVAILGGLFWVLAPVAIVLGTFAEWLAKERTPMQKTRDITVFLVLPLVLFFCAIELAQHFW